MLGIEDIRDGPLIVSVEQAGTRPACLGCGTLPVVKDREMVELIDLPYAGRPSRLRWRKVRWEWRNEACDMMTWTWDDNRIGFPRQALTDRAARWVTVQVGRCGRSALEVADELGCSWHTVNDAVIAYGEALIDDDPYRAGAVTALRFDEALFCRTGPFRRQHRPEVLHDYRGGSPLTTPSRLPIIAIAKGRFVVIEPRSKGPCIRSCKPSDRIRRTEMTIGITCIEQ